MNPEVGHLFDDGGNIYTEIDAKEYMRMRERNIREECVLQRISRGIDRAVEQATRDHRQEASQLQRALYDIQAKTCRPSAWDLLSATSSRPWPSSPATARRQPGGYHYEGSGEERPSLSKLSMRARSLEVERRTMEHRRQEKREAEEEEEEGEKNQLKPKRVDTRIKFKLKAKKSLPNDGGCAKKPGITNCKDSVIVKHEHFRQQCLSLPKISKDLSARDPPPVLETRQKWRVEGAQAEGLKESDLRPDEERALLKNSTRLHLRKASHISAVLDKLYTRRQQPTGRLRPLGEGSYPALTPAALLGQQNAYAQHFMMRGPLDKL